MFYVTIKNIKTKRFEVLILFSSLCVGDVIKWEVTMAAKLLPSGRLLMYGKSDLALILRPSR